MFDPLPFYIFATFSQTSFLSVFIVILYFNNKQTQNYATKGSENLAKAYILTHEELMDKLRCDRGEMRKLIRVCKVEKLKKWKTKKIECETYGGLGTSFFCYY